MPNEQETFDLYFTATLTGILANPAIISSVSQIAAINHQSGAEARKHIAACAYEYALIGMDMRQITRTKPYIP